MTKPELIDTIRTVNRTATREFLAEFSERDLGDYLKQLRELDMLPGSGTASRSNRERRPQTTSAYPTALPQGRSGRSDEIQLG